MGFWEIFASQGRTMKWLAREMNVHISYVSHLKAGRRRWTDALKERAAAALDVPVSVAFSHDGVDDDVDGTVGEKGADGGAAGG